jgi:hypothetical protein
MLANAPPLDTISLTIFTFRSGKQSSSPPPPSWSSWSSSSSSPPPTRPPGEEDGSALHLKSPGPSIINSGEANRSKNRIDASRKATTESLLLLLLLLLRSRSSPS